MTVVKTVRSKMKDDFEFMKYLIIGVAIILIGFTLGYNMGHATGYEDRLRMIKLAKTFNAENLNDLKVHEKQEFNNP